MCKVETFNEQGRVELERKINSFIQNKKVVSISYSTEMIGYTVHHYALVCYEV